MLWLFFSASPMATLNTANSLDELIKITGIVPQAGSVNINVLSEKAKKVEPISVDSIPQVNAPAACTQLAVNPSVPAGAIVKAASFAGGILDRVEKSNPYSTDNGFVKSKNVQNTPSTLDLANLLLKKYRIFEYKGALYIFNGKNYDILTADEIKGLCVNEYEPIVPSMKFATDLAGFVRLKATELESVNYKMYQSYVIFEDCVYNYLTNATYPHSDKYFIMHALNIPLATNLSDCPVFKKFIRDMAGGDETLYIRLLETTGYILSNDCFAKRFVALIGPGNTGKSAYGELIKQFFYSKNVTSYSPQALSGQFAGATLSTAALNICMDAPCLPLDPSSVAKLKALTGRDDVQGEIKYMNAFSYIFTGKLLFGLNDDIKITYHDPAFFDRVLYIPCRNIIPRHLRNPYLIEQMQNELSAIARLTLSCFANVVRRNYEFTGDEIYRYSSEPVTANGVFSSAVVSCDTVGEFVKECCIISRDGDLFTPTGMAVKGNKKRAVDFAEQVFDEFRASHKEGSEKQSVIICENSLYSDFLQSWLNTIKSNIQESTYQGYSRLVKEICSYFDNQNLHLNQIRPIHIQTYYNKLLERGLSANSVLHYHSIIRKSLQYAVKMDMLLSNPADKIDRPKKAKYKASFYNNCELREMFEAFKGDPMELVVYVVAYYGFRRSEVIGLKWEVIGLKWDCVDFDAKTITIKRKIIEVRINGSHEIISKEELKTESSKRTLPLIPSIEKMLLQRKHEQERNKQLCLNAYNTQYEDYIFVNDTGDLITPDYITSHFSNVLAKNGLRHIRFHDLRHSCASLLLSCGVPMKEIQLWLGHSNFSTTADIYSHLDYSSKVDAAIKIADVLDNGQ